MPKLKFSLAKILILVYVTNKNYLQCAKRVLTMCEVVEYRLMPIALIFLLISRILIIIMN